MNLLMRWELIKLTFWEERLQEDENTYITAEESMKLLLKKFHFFSPLMMKRKW